MIEPHRFGTIALAGPPNVGKSTLLNRIIGKKISIISRRPQTTRHRILGIKTMQNAQLVFIDTPGLHQNQLKGLNRVINNVALSSISDVDLTVFLIDIRGWVDDHEKLFSRVADKNTPTMLVINKIDLLRDRKLLLPLMKQSEHIHAFTEIMPLSTLKQENMDDFLKVLYHAMPEGPAGFPADQYTTRSESFLASELVREQTFHLLGQELPYASAVEVTKFEYKNANLLSIAATIWVEKASQKAIIIGSGGQQLKKVGQNARKQMERTFNTRVYLELWVKVRKGWADNEKMLRSLGYMEI